MARRSEQESFIRLVRTMTSLRNWRSGMRLSGFLQAERTAPRFSPGAIGGATGRTLLVTVDPDAMFLQALAAGASAASEMADEHGWRLGRIFDPFGREWEIGWPLGSWPPE
jgi:hypothetical protein